MRVALIYNLIRPELMEGAKLDAIAELDSEETIKALEEALILCGHTPVLLEATEETFETLRARKREIDIVLNIAEGMHGESRESLIPCFLEMLGIPYTGSGPLTLSVCLNKVRTKEILLSYGIPTPKYQVFQTSDDKVKRGLKFPLIVKLIGEGSSMGLSEKSVVHNVAQLRKQVRYLMREYGKDVFAEEFKSGREFTVPVIGNAPPQTLPIVEAVHSDKGAVQIVKFSPDSPVVKLLKLANKNPEIPRATHTTVCPAEIDEGLSNILRDLTIRSYKALGCRDWCRLEIRLDEEGNPFVLELNPIAGIHPEYWLPRSAKVAGMSYADLIGTIVNFAAKRYGLRSSA
jgi:D-alanine-D-alanine ligase